MYLHCLAYSALASPLLIPSANADAAGSHLRNRNLGYTGKFYVDYAQVKCAQDCDASTGPPCAGAPPAASGFPPVWFDTAEECCDNQLFWIDQGKCVADTNGNVFLPQGSTDWYVDWTINSGTCVQDCEGAPPCGGVKENWEPPYPTAEACCQTAIPWQPAESCALEAILPPTDTPTSGPTSSNSPTFGEDTFLNPTQSPTIDFPFLFDGIEDAESVFMGEIDLLWDYPTTDDGTIVDLATVKYHIMSAVGSYDFETYLQTSSPQDLILEFSQDSLSDDRIQYHLVDDGEEFGLQLNTTYYDELHSVLIVAEVDGVYSRNFQSTEIHASAEDPVMRDDINVVGIFVPTANLTITYENVTSDAGILEFDGPVLDEHKNLTVGDFIIGVTTDAYLFCFEILDVINSTDDGVALNTSAAQLEQIFESLDYQTSIAMSRPDKVLNTTSNRRYRHLVVQRAERKLIWSKLKSFGSSVKNGAVAAGNWVGDKAKDAGNFIVDSGGQVVRYIGDKATGVYNTGADIVELLGPVVIGGSGQLKKSYQLVDINRSYIWQSGPFSIGASVTVRSDIYARIKISLSSASYFEAGWRASYGAEFNLHLEGQLDIDERRRIWTGPKKEYGFVVVFVPVWLDVGPKLDMVLTAQGPPSTGTTGLTVGAKGSGSVSAFAGTSGAGTNFKPPNLTPYFTQNIFGDGTEYVLSVALEPAVTIRLYEGALSGDLGISAGLSMTTRSDNYDVDGSPVLALTTADIDFDFGVVVGLRSYFASSWNPTGTIFSQSWPIIGLPRGEIEGGDHSCYGDAIIDNIFLRDRGNRGFIDNAFASVQWYVEDNAWDPQKQSKFEVKLVKANFAGPLSIANGKIYAVARPVFPYFLPVVYSWELDEIDSSQAVSCSGSTGGGIIIGSLGSILSDGTGTSNLWYPDYGSGSCILDCQVGPFCKPAPPPLRLFDTADACCGGGLWWVDDDYCTSRSFGGYTDRWHVDWANSRCVKDCDPDTASFCESPPDFTQDTFATAGDCCGANLSWLASVTCVARSFLNTLTAP